MDRDTKEQVESDSEKGTNYAIAVSDVHLGFDKSDKDAFKEFLRGTVGNERINHLLLVGDILDMWRRDNENLMKDSEDVFKILQELKDNGNVGTIHYVIGNHDFSIEELRGTFFPINLFEFYSGSSEKRVWVELPQQTENTQFNGKKFKFMHGHQLSVGMVDPIFPIYDAFCIMLCKQGDFMGRVLSTIWDLRDLIPIIFTVVTLVVYYFFGILWSIAPGILTIISVIAILVHKRKAKIELSFDKQVELLIEALPYSTKRRVIHYLKDPPRQRKKFEEVSDRDIKKAYRSVKGRIPDITEGMAYDIINSVPKTLQTDRGFKPKKTIISNDQQVIGHTHEAVADGNPTNLGCWQKEHDYHYLVIDNSGSHRLETWTKLKVTRWQRMLSRLRK